MPASHSNDSFGKALVHLAKVSCEVEALRLEITRLSQQTIPGDGCAAEPDKDKLWLSPCADARVSPLQHPAPVPLPVTVRQCAEESEAEKESADKFRALLEAELDILNVECDKNNGESCQARPQQPSKQLTVKSSFTQGTVTTLSSQATNFMEFQNSVMGDVVLDPPPAKVAKAMSERWALMSYTLMYYDTPKGSGTAWDGFELLPFWMLTHRRNQDKDRRRWFATALETEQQEGIRAGDMLRDSPSWVQSLMIHPHGQGRLAFACAGIGFLAIDALAIPLQVFELGELAHALNYLSQAIAFYWLLDMVAHFFVGYQTHDGTIEMRPAQVHRNYLKGSFVPNLAIVLIDFSILLSEWLRPDLGSEAVKAGSRGLRFLRLCRLVRLVRARRLTEMINCCLNRLKSEHMVLGAKLAKHVALIFLANHYICCAWFFIATLDDEVSWITVYCEEDCTPGGLYAMSLHWALTQFSPSTQNIAPTNLRERIFASCVVLSALLVFSSFISSVTNAVNQLRTINMNRLMEEARIRKFLQAHDVSAKLVGNVQQFFGENYHLHKKRVHESDLKFFAEIPESLRIQLHEELYKPLLLGHLLFKVISSSDMSLMRKICHLAMGELSLLPRQDVFIDGTESDSMYFVTNGSLIYEMIRKEERIRKSTSGRTRAMDACPSTISGRISHNSEPEDDSGLEKVEVPSKSWASEMALWAKWVHRGHLAAADYSEMVKMNSLKFGQAVAHSGGPMSSLMRTFAIFSVAHAEAVELTEPLSDLPIASYVTVQFIERAYAYSKLRFANNFASEGGCESIGLADMMGRVRMSKSSSDTSLSGRSRISAMIMGPSMQGGAEWWGPWRELRNKVARRSMFGNN